ncbi:bifunctional UDP-N-acetylglucosamine diphosphorylase/glucosamine-1-phosphate N-acetyltransferase GlmU [Ornithinibacillus halophilus]|uniref:Bifunctional protein GlmU n=1 Tax=Ornithinibacillus halophilus TaxID=930117 RepID=A0A1M5JJZ7_9BACI|nr:bifunctional UDP-N-acetylglucosamine diphosphorylase/glucosamine-1-phosphate N-acetyltransferase GlmU [Ornithinibacillus halophilus]SHG40887.1 UDP-N-acetylglucosamine pyrophosphorylase /glucosamine-1-phosphate N-acetyltransferase [Ornithinibacillus halophilus]
MTKRFAVILAAGQGTRMKSKLYKVLHPVLGRPMVQHVLEQVNASEIDQVVTVVGHGAEKVKEYIGDGSEFVLQSEQLGTGHAVIQAEALLKDKDGITIVVCGDTPLIKKETYQALFEHHEKSGATATILTAVAPNPTGYGRVIRNEQQEVERIVEHKDANEQELKVNEINTGTYCFDNRALFEALQEVSNDNAQGEYYLPDVIEILKNKEMKVSAYQTPDFDETLGVNDRVALSQAERIMKRRINEGHMRNGVTIIDPDNTYIQPDVVIEQDVVIHPGSVIKGQSVIKENAVIGPHTEITNCTVGEDTVIKQSVATDSYIGQRVNIGPYAHIRPEASIGNEVKIGNFVEIKKTKIDKNSKVSHLSYIGDAEVGSNVNVGCGTITVNYDGKNKYLTKIEDDAFIGCNSNLIAPVTVGKGSYVAAGSTITKDIPDDALSVARARQTNKEGYASKLKNRLKD